VTLVEFGQAIIKRGGPIPKAGQVPPADITGTFTLFPTAQLPFHWAGIYGPIHGQIPDLMQSDDMQFVCSSTMELWNTTMFSSNGNLLIFVGCTAAIRRLRKTPKGACSATTPLRTKTAAGNRGPAGAGLSKGAAGCGLA
jgi:hypothetical protein